jgi:hypothetical protein
VSSVIKTQLFIRQNNIRVTSDAGLKRTMISFVVAAYGKAALRPPL